jgi:hypothetical protein
MPLIPALKAKVRAWLDANFATALAAPFPSQDILLGSRLNDLSKLGQRVLNEGASLIAIQDAGNYFTAPYNVESALQQLGAGGGGGGGGAPDPSDWTVPEVGDLTIVCEGAAGQFKIAGSDGTDGLRGVSASRDDETCDGMALLPLPATLADGKRVAIKVGYMAYGSDFTTGAPGIICAADIGGGSWSGPTIYLDVTNPTQMIGARVTASPTALAFADLGTIKYKDTMPQFLGFARDGSSIYYEYSIDGVNWVRPSGASASTPTADLTHIGIWIYNRGNAVSQGQIQSFTIQDVL